MALLVAVAVLCAWLAWERSVVMERRAARAKFEERAAFVFFDPPVTKVLSFIRTALGDEPVEIIALSADITPAERDRLAGLFPEASIDPLGLRPSRLRVP